MAQNYLTMPGVTEKKKIKINYPLIFLLLPGLMVFLLFTIYPIVKLLIMSFFDWQLGLEQKSVFVGFKNYLQVITDPICRKAIANTLVYALVTVPRPDRDRPLCGGFNS